jgi:hypothetical protein
VIAQGSCHCGTLRFRVELGPDERDVLDCNCSMCTKKGILHLIVPEARFALESGGDALVTYTFGTGVARHMFCGVCGAHAFYRPRSHPDAWDVNVRCIEDVPLEYWRVRRFDGANWEQAFGELPRQP